jgi:hypothetical protein
MSDEITVFCGNKACRFYQYTFALNWKCVKRDILQMDTKGKCVSFEKDNPANIKLANLNRVKKMWEAHVND